MPSPSTALRLTGRDVLPLLHRTTSNALADLVPGGARATLFCDFRGRLQHRAVVAVAHDGAVWLLRDDAPGDTLAAAVDRMVFRDDVAIEDRSASVTVTLVADPARTSGVLEAATGLPTRVSTGDGTALVLGDEAATPLDEASRIALLHPRHDHEIAEAWNPFEVGLGHEVHLAKGCFTGQEALQRLITYTSVRRRPAHVRLAHAPESVPADVFVDGESVGRLTSVAGLDAFALLAMAPVEAGAAFTLADGGAVTIVAAPEPSRPLGRP
jgi:folate-binding protein YgfZ